MTQNKWHKEIKAWADGTSIEMSWDNEKTWVNFDGDWVATDGMCYRIKPQPKETQYLYVYFDSYVNRVAFTKEKSDVRTYRFLGKLKLEVGDEPVHST